MNAPANIESQASDEPYVIRKGASFYKPNFSGYTSHIEAAGIYSKEQALAVAEDRRSYAGAIPEHQVSAQPLSDYTLVIEEASRLLAEKRAALGMPPLWTLDVTVDDDLRQIATRHTLDANWFTGGLHDPNGYVAVAHKDRGALLERLRALRTGQVRDPRTITAVPGVYPTEDQATALRSHLRLTISEYQRAEELAKKTAAAKELATITIPKAAYDWLMGEGPDDEGLHFGAKPGYGAYWWRTTFRRMCGR